MKSLDVSQNKALTRLGCMDYLEVTFFKHDDGEKMVYSWDGDGFVYYNKIPYTADIVMTVKGPQKVTLTFEDGEFENYEWGYGNSDLIVDWGIKNQNLDYYDSESGSSVTFEKNYEDDKEYTITIYARGNVSGARLICDNNNLTSFVSGAWWLSGISCQDNNLTELHLDFSGYMNSVYCNNNKITSLKLPTDNEIGNLNCSFNELTELDLSDVTYIDENIDCSNNKLSASALDAMFESMPESEGEINIENNPGTTDCNRSIAEEKGWTVIG